jgi:aspartate-semialdehyde dehydrogenase
VLYLRFRGSKYIPNIRGKKVSKYIIGVIGVTGAVGEEILRVLEEGDLPIKKLIAIASKKSVGKEVEFNNKTIKIQELTHEIFKEEKIDIAIFSAGGSISASFAPSAVSYGTYVIDNTSYFRMDKDIPLIVPEVNAQDLLQDKYKNSKIIANPNCSTIQMVQALNGLDKKYNIEKINVSTYQAVSGAGISAAEELFKQMQSFLSFGDMDSSVFAHQIAINCIPAIDKAMESGYTKEEEKMIYETSKIMNKKMEISATCVRVPVFRGHSEAISITCKNSIQSVDEAKVILQQTENIVVKDNLEKNIYPMPIDVGDKNETYVGRVRKDMFNENTLHLFCVADNLRVGAATNSVRIAKKLIEFKKVKK